MSNRCYSQRGGFLREQESASHGMRHAKNALLLAEIHGEAAFGFSNTAMTLPSGRLDMATT